MNIISFILIFVLCVGGVLGVFIWFMVQFKHRLIIHRKTGSKTVDYVIKFRVVRDKDGTELWIPLKDKKLFGDKIKPCPTENIMVTPKGTMSVNCSWDGFKKFQWLDPSKASTDKKYEVLTDEQKAIYLKMMRDAESWKKPTISDLIMKFAGIGAIVILVVALMVFYGDMAKPLITMSGQLKSFQDKQFEMMQLFQEVIQNKKWVAEDFVPPDASVEEPPPP